MIDCNIPAVGPKWPIHPAIVSVGVGAGADRRYMPPMFADLLRRLTAPSPSTLPDPEARLALAALLVRLARTDGDYAADEVAHIDRVLCSRYRLSPKEAAFLRTEAETLEAEAPDTVRFTRAIKDAVPHEDREAVVEALWSVALADQVRDDQEDGFLRLVANLLGVNDRDSAFARQRAASARNTGAADKG